MNAKRIMMEPATNNGQAVIRPESNPQSTKPELLTKEDLQARWSCSTMKLNRWMRAGKLPFIKLGVNVRFRFADILRIEAEGYASAK